MSASCDRTKSDMMRRPLCRRWRSDGAQVGSSVDIRSPRQDAGGLWHGAPCAEFRGQSLICPSARCWSGGAGCRAPPPGRVPGGGIGAGRPEFRWRIGRLNSCGRGGQHEGEIIAQGRDRFQGHVAGPLHRPLVVLLEQDGAPTRRVIAASLGKMPTTSVRRSTSPLTRSSGLVEWNLARCSLGKFM